MQSRVRNAFFDNYSFEDFFFENIRKTPFLSFSLLSFLITPLASLSLELSADIRWLIETSDCNCPGAGGNDVGLPLSNL